MGQIVGSMRGPKFILVCWESEDGRFRHREVSHNAYQRLQQRGMPRYKKVVLEWRKPERGCPFHPGTGQSWDDCKFCEADRATFEAFEMEWPPPLSEMAK